MQRRAVPRHQRHNLGKRDAWAAQTGYKLDRDVMAPGQNTPRRNDDKDISDEEAAIRIAMAFKLRELQESVFIPLPIQIQPKEDEDTSWDTWILRGGRGSGKTEGASRYVLAHLRKYGAKARVGVGAKTIADARDTCAEGLSGLITIAPHEFYYHRSIGEARHIKGGYVKFMGAEEPARWNGPQWSLLWGDEISLWPRETYDQAQLGLRIGEFPRTILSTTPKTARWVEEIEKLSTTVHTTGTLKQNHHLSEFARNKLIRMYQGTHLEKRELEGEWFYESPNALWHEDLFQHVDIYPNLARIVIAIDPAVTSGETADDTGIVAGGIDNYNRSLANGYILKDKTCHLPPLGWAETAIALYDELNADLIVAEVNNGGDLVEATLRTIRPNIPFKKIHASRGKMIRAQPIVSLYEQKRVYHVSHAYNTLVPLETEMCSWDPTSYVSPNRMDAAVWVLTELMMELETKRIMRVVYDNHVSISRY